MLLLHFSTGRQIFYVSGLIFYGICTGTKARVTAADLIDLDGNMNCFMWPMSSCNNKTSYVSQCRILVAVQYMKTQLLRVTFVFTDWNLQLLDCQSASSVCVSQCQQWPSHWLQSASSVCFSMRQQWPSHWLLNFVTVDADWHRQSLLTDSRRTSPETRTQASDHYFTTLSQVLSWLLMPEQHLILLSRGMPGPHKEWLLQHNNSPPPKGRAKHKHRFEHDSDSCCTVHQWYTGYKEYMTGSACCVYQWPTKRRHSRQLMLGRSRRRDASSKIYKKQPDGNIVNMVTMTLRLGLY